MQTVMPLACFLSMIRPPGVQYENALLQIAPVDKAKCPYLHDNHDISYQLYTRHNPTSYQTLSLNDDEALFASNMDFHAPTLIYFHAFMEQPDDGSGIMVREAYMQRGDTNVIMVEAARLEAGPWYFTAAQNTWYIGRHAAKFIDYMVQRGLNLNNTHLVGHSLGAQAAGVAGSAITSGRVSRITGLDPALPLFSGLPLLQRLDPSDAHFVDVIHTDAGIFGYKEAIGHVDFFPNGGQSPQPGCELEVVIPQQLLLNKCHHTHRTRGFYTYYLTTRKLRQQTSLDRKILDNTGLDAKTSIGNTKTYRNYNKIEYFGLKDNSKIHKGLTKTRVQRNVNENFDVTKENQQEVTTTKTNVDHDFVNNRNSADNVTEIAKIEIGLNSTSNTKTNSSTHVKTRPDGRGDRHDESKRVPFPAIRLRNPKKFSIFNKQTKQLKNRQKRFLPFSRNENDDNSNFLFRILDFLVKNRKSIVPVTSVVRDITTLVRSAGGELRHATRERNNYVGFAPPELTPLTYTLELGGENKVVAFVKRLLGVNPKGDRLTIGSG